MSVDVATDGGTTWETTWVTPPRAATPGDVYVGTRTLVPVSGGLTVDTVRDSSSRAGLVGATITDLQHPVSTAVTVATPDDPRAGDGLFTLFVANPGKHTLRASAPATPPQARRPRCMRTRQSVRTSPEGRPGDVGLTTASQGGVHARTWTPVHRHDTPRAARGTSRAHLPQAEGSPAVSDARPSTTRSPSTGPPHSRTLPSTSGPQRAPSPTYWAVRGAPPFTAKPLVSPS